MTSNSNLLLKKFFLFILIILLASCSAGAFSSQALPPAPTNTPDLILQLSSTPVFESELPLTLTLTPGPVRDSNLVLPNNLQLEEFPINEGIDYYEFFQQIQARHPEKGERIRLSPNSRGNLKDGPFEVLFESLPYASKVTVKFEGQDNFELDCYPSPVDPILNAGYVKKDWYVSTYCQLKLIIFSNGISLNETKGYEQSFGFQLMEDLPLYLYEKDGYVGISYNGVDTALNYDRLAFSFGEGGYPWPANFEHMITFTAFKGKQLYYVAIGQFNQ